MVPATFVQSKLVLGCCVQRGIVHWLPAALAQTEQHGPASSMQATFVQSSVVPATFVQSKLVLRSLVLWTVVPETFVQSKLVRWGTV